MSKFTLNLREQEVIRAMRTGMVVLELGASEAHAVHHALSAMVDLIRQVGEIPADAPLHGQEDRLVRVAQRLDHERRHRGTVPNPNGPQRAGEPGRDYAVVDLGEIVETIEAATADEAVAKATHGGTLYVRVGTVEGE